jgi:hypothetical protein
MLHFNLFLLMTQKQNKLECLSMGSFSGKLNISKWDTTQLGS